MPVVLSGGIKMKKSLIAFLFILTLGHSVECFNDTCDGQQYLCGSVCLDNDHLCDCGGQDITQGWINNKYCCAPPSACTRTQNQNGAKCSSGDVLSSYPPVPCNATGKFFNDVLTSQHSGQGKYEVKA